MLDYLREETHSFSEKPFGALDSFVLANTSYLLFENAIPAFDSIAGVREAYNEEPVLVSDALRMNEGQRPSDLFWLDETAPLFANALSDSPRYKDLRISDVCAILEPHTLTQFCAMTFHVPDGSIYISFRGTDNTLTGWQEDLTMCVLDPIPSQIEALAYTKAIIQKWVAPPSGTAAHAQAPDLRLGGHSKGGNLAFYSALFCEEYEQDFITEAFNYDGPGFNRKYLATPARNRIAERLHKYIPAQSLFGQFFEDLVEPEVISSREKGIMQHMPFSWKLNAETGYFVQDEQEFLSRVADEGFTNWLEDLSLERRIEFLGTLFGILDFARTDDRIETLAPALLRKSPHIIHFLRELDNETQVYLLDVLLRLVEDLVESAQDTLHESVIGSWNALRTNLRELVDKTPLGKVID